ncbi:hypothetical protein AKJ44_01430 [candidate division MSBL1 archaeon SCGC-AAA261F17]|uniref:PIN domain-containing protein n=1 Tax=candidate division MSBL1 archaeon SCGC-AAA261F17 TaxID=1698274 RepID=A0A133V6J6_9EURY|nr:hypothetical protein AKJ44_01430 [candidate division MSBL1 archaeon SCGC-AAA261F17]
MTVLVDSWAWIEYFKGSEAGGRAREIIEDPSETIILSTINIAEVYRRILEDYDETKAEEKREVMKDRSFVHPVDEDIAVDSAKIKIERRWGLGDSIIYATAKRENAKVLTGDPHFKGLEETIFIE